MRLGVILLLSLLCITARSQRFYGASMQGMANTGLAVPSVYGLTANPAVVAKLERPQIGIGYQPHFLTQDIQTHALVASLPLRKYNTLGLAINNYGLKGTSSLLTVRAVYVRAFGDYFSTSVSTNYHQYHVKGYGGDNAVSMDLGAHFTFTKAMAIGLLLRNISFSRFDDSIDQSIAREIGMGLLYHISKEVLFTADAYYTALGEIDPRFGIAYSIDKLVVLRGGITLVPMQYFTGVGMTLGKFLCDISSSFHTQLGASPQVSLVYGF
ncbi:hypothetical protein [Sphingobacterium faecale]|uniref:Type IX secretion system PorP/SprF family membrane protein n=1 Tax=Sphingobacterium faecale TaxID=2803775 RepID=A0ABS1R975_9SPHI|nr:hypothetical protein [Sphingobacterium faecale]MBL1411267.1 hypothetical protein [Sphingobacterium faecale]